MGKEWKGLPDFLKTGYQFVMLFIALFSIMSGVVATHIIARSNIETNRVKLLSIEADVEKLKVDYTKKIQGVDAKFASLFGDFNTKYDANEKKRSRYQTDVEGILMAVLVFMNTNITDPKEKAMFKGLTESFLPDLRSRDRN